jgi:hypothetical protein
MGERHEAFLSVIFGMVWVFQRFFFSPMRHLLIILDRGAFSTAFVSLPDKNKSGGESTAVQIIQLLFLSTWASKFRLNNSH